MGSGDDCLVLSTEFTDKVNWTPYRETKADVSSVSSSCDQSIPNDARQGKYYDLELTECGKIIPPVFLNLKTDYIITIVPLFFYFQL